jgi:hypothetical protein
MTTSTTGIVPQKLHNAMLAAALSPKNPDGTDLQFSSREAASAYKAAIVRLDNAIGLKESDRIPVSIFPNMAPVNHYGCTMQDAMYNYDTCTAAFKKFYLDFKPDYQWGAVGPGPGKFYEIMDYKLYAWPGHGVAPEHSYQCNEGEYMKEDEYDALITDPSLYFRNRYLPRVFGALGGLSMLAPWTNIIEMYGVAFNFIPFGLPPVQETFKALFNAGAEALAWATALGHYDGEMASLGFPNLCGGYSLAPFDMIGDALRGTMGIMTDMFRQPDKLLHALDAVTPIMINMGIASANITGKPLIFIPLHKGADGFLSNEQYKKFYWPTLQKVIIGLIEGGCIPLPSAEGGYNTRLEIINDLPKGKTLWMFDQTDIVRAKKIVGDTLCIFGNISSSMLELGTPQEVSGYVKSLIDNVGPGGGFVLANGAFFDKAQPQNLTAMIETALTYGSY